MKDVYVRPVGYTAFRQNYAARRITDAVRMVGKIKKAREAAAMRRLAAQEVRIRANAERWQHWYGWNRPGTRVYNFRRNWAAKRVTQGVRRMANLRQSARADYVRKRWAARRIVDAVRMVGAIKRSRARARDRGYP